MSPNNEESDPVPAVDLQNLGFYDALTGLPNRRLLEEQLRQTLSSAPGKWLALFFLDLNGFKEVNDSYGHKKGDLLLKLVASRLLQSLRPGDLLARQGGDEFIVLAPQVENDEAAGQIARDMLKKLRERFQLNGKGVNISASIGIVRAQTGTGADADELLHCADTAMYEAKVLYKKGGGGWKVFTEEIRRKAIRHLELSSDLELAITQCQLSVVFHPIVRLKDLTVVGAEALLRWKHPKYGEVSPEEFIPMAEQSGVIVPIGEWVLRRACETLQAWHLAKPQKPRPYLTVNLSPRQLIQSTFTPMVGALLAEFGLDPRYLKLEVTESAFLFDAEAILRTIRELEALQIQLCVDDFGTGFSCLGHLADFPKGTAMKIDRTFVGKMELDPKAMIIVRTIARLADELRSTIVAEGIESHDQAVKLSALGCQFGQGHFFSEPTSADAVLQMILHGLHQRK